MFNVTLVQPNFQTGPKHLNSYYLPYTVGALWAYLLQFQDVYENFTIDNWIFRREDFNEVISKCKNTNIVFISLYIWNKNYCLRLAEELKKVYPDITIIMGGPEVPHRDKKWIEENDYIDSIVIGEGELAIKEILTQYLYKIPLEKTYQFDRIKDLNLPSPYTKGLFDDLLEEHPDIEWVPTLETDRGCPYSCTFCDWGSATASKMYKLYNERIQKDIEWMIDKKLPYIALTSSNFGIFKDRDLEITEQIIKANKETGFPSGLSVSYAKNSNATVLDIVKKFLDVNIQTGLVLSLQTTSEDVLDNIKRKNMKINSIEEIVSMCNEKNVPVLTELILGMPGETSRSWMTTLEDVLQNKIGILDTYFLQLLVNSPMYVSQLKEYKLETFEGYDFFYGVQNETFETDKKLNISESIEVIKSTSTLPEDELEELSIFTAFVMGMHIFGLTNIIANYLHDNKGVKYMNFYKDLYDYVKENDTQMQNILNELKDGIQDWKKVGYMDARIGGVYIEGWKFFHALMPIIQNNNSVLHYLYLVKDFCEMYKLKDNLLNEYIKVSNLQIKQFENPLVNPVKVTITSDLFPCNLTISDRYNDFTETKEAHLDMLFFGRRRGWHINKIDLDK